jgi:Skp family chaperone for outer membrane proteins
VKIRGIQLVFNVDAGTIAWFDPSLDITAEVVKQVALK